MATVKKMKKAADGAQQPKQPIRKFTTKDYQRKDSVPSEMFPGKMIPKSAVRKGSYITTTPKKKMKDGGSLKPVPAEKEKSLGKLPKPVRNKMGFQKDGGKTKAKSGAKMGKCKYGCK